MIKIETETKILSLRFNAARKMSRVLYKGPWHWQGQWSRSCARASGRMEELYEKSYMLASKCLQHREPLLSKSLWVQAMKRSRTFQSSATDDAVAVQKVLALIKAFTPATLMLGALEGSPLFYKRDDFQDFDSLVKELVTYDPYIKKSTLEAVLVNLDNEHTKKCLRLQVAKGFGQSRKPLL
jgi:hypothetical protein